MQKPCEIIYYDDLNEVALNTAPLIHRDMKLTVRAETSLCGFIVCDLFRLLAVELQHAMSVPTGSTFLAPQTATNIQSVALATVVICLSKSEHFSPWTHGKCRLSELPVEHWFGALRKTSTNSQLTARMYWMAGAKESLKLNKLLNQRGLHAEKSEPALTQEQYLV